MDSAVKYIETNTLRRGYYNGCDVGNARVFDARRAVVLHLHHICVSLGLHAPRSNRTAATLSRASCR